MNRVSLGFIAILALSFGCDSDDNKTGSNHCNFEEHSVSNRQIYWCEGNNLVYCDYDNTLKVLSDCEADGEVCYKTTSGLSKCIQDDLGKPCDPSYERVKCSGERVVKCINNVWTLLKDCQQSNETCVFYSNNNNARCEMSCDYKEFMQNGGYNYMGVANQQMKIRQCSKDASAVADFYCGSKDNNVGFRYIIDTNKNLQECGEHEMCENGSCSPSESCRSDKCVGNTIYQCVSYHYWYKKDCFYDEICTINEETKSGKCVENTSAGNP